MCELFQNSVRVPNNFVEDFRVGLNAVKLCMVTIGALLSNFDIPAKGDMGIR